LTIISVRGIISRALKEGNYIKHFSFSDAEREYRDTPTAELKKLHDEFRAKEELYFQKSRTTKLTPEELEKMLDDQAHAQGITCVLQGRDDR